MTPRRRLWYNGQMKVLQVLMPCIWIIFFLYGILSTYRLCCIWYYAAILQHIFNRWFFTVQRITEIALFFFHGIFMVSESLRTLLNMKFVAEQYWMNYILLILFLVGYHYDTRWNYFRLADVSLLILLSICMVLMPRTNRWWSVCRLCSVFPHLPNC